MATYTLQSAEGVHTPGLIAWAKSGYAFPRDRKRIAAVFVEGYKLPLAAAKAMLSGDAELTVNADASVSFTWPRPRLTQSAVKAELAALDITFRKTDYDEFRVNLRGADEGPAYYASDLQDALDTGRAMAERRDNPPPVNGVPCPVDPANYCVDSDGDRVDIRTGECFTPAVELVEYVPFYPPVGRGRVIALAGLDAYRGRS